MTERLATEAENLRILESFNATSRPYPRDRCIHHAFEEQASRTPDAPAIIHEGRELSYRQFNERANQLAHHLIALGVGPDVLVGVCLERSVEMVVSLYAILKAGGAYVPLEPDYPVNRTKSMLADASPRAVITSKALRERLLGDDGRVLCLDDCPAIERQSKENPGVGLAGGNLAYVIYTSGSTGVPKGTMNTHGGIYNGLRWMQDEYRLAPPDRMLQQTRFSFDVSVCEFFWPLMYGGALVVARPHGHRDPAYLTRTIVDQKISTMHIVPSMLDLLLQHPDIESCRSLKRVICSGEALSMATQRRFFAKLSGELHNLYGPAEAAVHVTYWACRPDDRGEVVPIGRPIANTQIYILDDARIPVSIGESGELYIGGHNVSRGYLNRPELTAERFIFDPFCGIPGQRMYRTGDLARWRQDGNIEYLGRIDYQVKIRGQRVELGEIEAVLAKHPSVRQCVVVAREDSAGDKRLAAYIVVGRDQGQVDTHEDLGGHLRKFLPEHMVPAVFVKMGALPLNANGKIDRNALPAPSASDRPRAIDGEAPRDDLERGIAGIFANVLGTPVEKRDADFFFLGGHSLLAWRVVVLCEARLGVTLSINAVFSHPSVAALAEFVRREKEQGQSAAEVARVPRAGVQPLTPQQYALWLELKLRPDAYNEPIAFRVAARLAPERVRGALERLAAAHEILRARLVEQEGEPRFVFEGTPASIELEVLEDAAVDLQAALRRPFELARGPLWRAVLHQDPRGGSVLLLVVHHMIMDAASEEILLREFAAAYADPAAALPARAYDFCDLAAHERERLVGEQAALERFWAETLAGAQLTPDLPPPCVPCAPGEEERGCSTRRTVPPALARAIRALAANLGTTPFHIYLAAYLTLLRTYTASDDLVVGSIASLRDTPAAQDVVGYLLSPVALRVELAGNRSFRETVAEVARRWQDVRAHARLPMHLVLAASGARRAGIGSPFQVFFSLIQDAKASLNIDGQPLLPVHVPAPQVKFKLFLLVEERAEDASLALEFQRGALDPDMAQRLLAHLEQILRGIAENPDRPLSDLPLLMEAERRQLQLEWNETASDYPAKASIHELLQAQAKRTPERTAIRVGAVAHSYAALETRANRLAQALRSRGVGRGQRVGLCVERGADMLAAMLGILKAGAAYVPLDPAFPAERLRFMAEDAQLTLLVSTNALAGPFDFPRERQLLLDIDAADLASRPDRRLTPDAALDACPEDPAYIIYTSGSTGKPKGVVVPHRAVVNFLTSMAREPGLCADDVLVAVTTLSFDIAVLELLLPLTLGATVVIASRDEAIDGRALGALLEKHGATVMQATPVTWRLLLAAGWAARPPFKALVGGEALPKDLADQLIARGVELWNMYGPTETTVWSTCAPITGSANGITIGKPIANTTVYILDAHRNLCPIGVPGELCIGGTGVTLGYWNLPELTAERFIPDLLGAAQGATLYRTGDRARWRTDGGLEHLGRLDFQIKIRGYRIELGEIEATLDQHSGVEQSVAVAREDTPGDQRLVAYVVARRQAAPSAAKLKEHLSRTLPEYMVPNAFVFMAALPLTPNGKIDRSALPMPGHSGSESSYVAPRTASEEIMERIWAEVLGLERVSVEDNFFELGGTSLLALKMLVRVERELGIAIPVRVVVEGRTIRRIATMLADSPHLSLPNGVALIREGDLKRPLFFLPGLGGVALQFVRLAARMRTWRAVFAIELHELEVDSAVLESMAESAVTVARLMRQAQAQGPYSILGYSYGGNLAVEVAGELLRQGQDVELVAVLDAYAPGSVRNPSGLNKVARHLRILWRLRLHEAYDYLASRVLRRLGLRSEREPALPMPESGLERRLAETVVLGRRAFSSYRPGPFEGRIVLVHASDLGDWMEIADPSGTCGWGGICKGGVDVIQIGCKHLDLFKEPNLSELARRLDEVLALSGFR